MSTVPLKVLNASAGSGKTYSLVKTFMHLLLSNEDFNIAKYGEILAMTFTNKAALEMKIRIIGALDKLSQPTSNQDHHYLNEIAQELSQSTTGISDKASKVLYHILHNYEAFNVLTIDKFNLRLIRSFSKDLNLPSDFEVVINETPIIEQVVDNILNEIGKENDISKYILAFVDSNFEEETNWDIRKDLIEFSRILTKEQDIPFVNLLMETTYSKEEFEQFRQELKHYHTVYEDKCKSLYHLYTNNNLDKSKVPGGLKTMKRFENLKNLTTLKDAAFTPTFVNAINNGDAEKKGMPLDMILASEQLIRFEEENMSKCKRLELILKNYYNMALLQYINEALQGINQNERLIRISEFNALIQNLLLQEDTLYIYEKLGVKFKHFMLDEFQDTSRLQWLNLVPLLHESISKGDHNLIVGDPKQAIYRFKNGVAEQFVALPSIYNPEGDSRIAEMSRYFEKQGEVTILPNNFRSSKEIVQFNNHLFTALSYGLGDVERTFYNNIIQEPKSKKSGYISVEATLTKKFAPLDSMPFIEKCIEEAKLDGYKLGDICILGSTNSSCSIWANDLTSKGYKIVSADSLNIDYDQDIKLIISYLTLINTPNDENCTKQFVHNYCLAKQKNPAFYYSYFSNDEKGYVYLDLERFLIENIPDYIRFFHKFESLYDLVQNSYSLFDLQELKNTYLHHFADMVFQFEIKNGPDLPTFLKEYKTLPKESKAVQIPESDDAIKVMTIHKSKGLEFPIVILVHEVKNESNRKKHFVRDKNDLLYTQLSKNSPIKKIVEMESIESRKDRLDKLNKYYVAYTRPEERLYLSIPCKDNTLDKEIASIILESEIELDVWKTKTYGERQPKIYKTEAVSSHYYTPYSNTENLWFPDIALQNMQELGEKEFLSDERRYGTQFHYLIANSKSINSLNEEIKSSLESGIIEEAFVERLKEDLQSVFSNNEYTSLFEGAIEVINETGIILSKSELIRPDKIILKKDETIIIDFKTGLPKPQDIKQLKNYKGALQEMKYTRVRAFIFYLFDKGLQEV